MEIAASRYFPYFSCMPYTKGVHLLADLSGCRESQLLFAQPFRVLMEELISRHQLQCLGTVYHDFSPAGFTAVVCLSESHISIHTWPEYQRANLDIYLSNFKQVNDGTVRAIYESLHDFFNPASVKKMEVQR